MVAIVVVVGGRRRRRPLFPQRRKNTVKPDAVQGAVRRSDSAELQGKRYSHSSTSA